MARSIPPLPDEDHTCHDCGIAYSSIPVAVALEAIGDMPTAVADSVLSLSDECLRQRPDAATWSVLQYVCHLRDVYSVYTIRLYRARVENRPVLEPMLNDLRAVRFRYNERELGPVVAELKDNVAGLIDEAARFADEDWERVVRRLPGENRTARWLLRQVMHEGSHHLRDISSVARRVGRTQ